MDTAVKPPVQPLSATVIVDAALALIETEGADALTFRKLGAALGVAPTAVLRHFRDKDDLLLALGDRLLREALARPTPEGAGWQDRIRHLAFATRETFVAHPRLAVLVAGRTLQREAEFRAANVVIEALLEAGLEGAEAARTYRAIVDTVLAWTAFEASLRSLDPATESRDRLAWVGVYTVLPEQDYPGIHAVAGELAAADREDQFADSLDLLLEAVVARVGR